MDPDSFAVAVCRGEDQPAGFAGTNPQDDKFCDGGVPVGGGRPVGFIALLTGAGARLGWKWPRAARNAISRRYRRQLKLFIVKIRRIKCCFDGLF